MDENIITLASAAALGTNVLINALRLAFGLHARFLPLLALGMGILIVALVHVSSGGTLAQTDTARIVLAGIVAGGAAAGATELQQAVERNKGHGLTAVELSFEPYEHEDDPQA